MVLKVLELLALLAAAGCWFYSAMLKRGPAPYDPRAVWNGAEIIDTNEQTGEKIAWGATMRAQSRWGAVGAVFAAVAVILSGIQTLLSWPA